MLWETKTGSFNEAQRWALKGGQEQMKNRKQLSADVYWHGIINIHVCSNRLPTEEVHWGNLKKVYCSFFLFVKFFFSSSFLEGGDNVPVFLRRITSILLRVLFDTTPECHKTLPLITRTGFDPKLESEIVELMERPQKYKFKLKKNIKFSIGISSGNSKKCAIYHIYHIYHM